MLAASSTWSNLPRWNLLDFEPKRNHKGSLVCSEFPPPNNFIAWVLTHCLSVPCWHSRRTSPSSSKNGVRLRQFSRSLSPHSRPTLPFCPFVFVLFSPQVPAWSAIPGKPTLKSVLQEACRANVYWMHAVEKGQERSHRGFWTSSPRKWLL